MKRVFILLAVLVLVVACGQVENTETPAENSNEEAVEVAAVEEEPTAEEIEETEATAEPMPGEATAVVPSDLPFPATNLAEAMIVRERDHTLGSVDPLITIVEYGDFQ